MGRAEMDPIKYSHNFVLQYYSYIIGFHQSNKYFTHIFYVASPALGY